MIFFATFTVFLLICLYFARKRKNRYTNRLPPPSPLCSRGFDYK